FPLELKDIGANPTLRLIDGEFWAELQPNPDRSGMNSAWAWREVLPLGNGSWEYPLYARQGTTQQNPAYESNNNGVQYAIARMIPGINGEYIFEYCCGGGISSSVGV